MLKIEKKFRSIPYHQRRGFNCGGFALGTLDWYRPYCWDFIFEDDYNTREEFEEAFHEMFEDCCDDILCVNPSIRRLDREEEATRNERVFFFRLSEDDFHFVTKIGRKYFEKKGSTPFLEEKTKEEVYAPEWAGRYFGEIGIFAINKKKGVAW